MSSTPRDDNGPSATQPQPEATASFGFRDVPRQDRQTLVNDVFDKVADRYDLMNDLMSGGLHRLWKRDLVTVLNPPRGNRDFRLLDVAGGTGDVAMRVVNTAGPNTTAVLCDINAEMLKVGARRIEDAGLTDQITTLEANAERLPLEDKSFDAYTIAFGIRNVTDMDAALREAFRVLKVGGRFVCLEFSHVDVPVLDKLYDFHSFEVIPRLGKWMTDSEDSYAYLVESIRKFPKQDAFAERLRAAGFEQVQYQNLTGGIAALHSGWKL
jgi:demethylmenaquinone methyltransferase / 2-methoxy-6-polyprenyl-1,4-benzoquinol methylase